MSEKKKKGVGTNIGRFVDILLKDEEFLFNVSIFSRGHTVLSEKRRRRNWEPSFQHTRKALSIHNGKGVEGLFEAGIKNWHIINLQAMSDCSGAARST